MFNVFLTSESGCFRFRVVSGKLGHQSHFIRVITEKVHIQHAYRCCTCLLLSAKIRMPLEMERLEAELKCYPGVFYGGSRQSAYFPMALPGL